MDQYDYTQKGEDLFLEIADNKFSAKEIYGTIKIKLKEASFSRVLRRLMYFRFFADTYSEQKQIPKEEFKEKFISLFKENKTPCSFTQTTAKLSTLAESCLTKDIVKRSTVLLIGFGMKLGTKDVNTLLTKGIKEYGLNPKDPFEVICWYCYENNLSFADFQRLRAEYEALEYNPCEERPMYQEYTAVAQDYMYGIENEDELKNYLSTLKTSENKTKISKTSLEVFNELFEETVSHLEEYCKAKKKRGAKTVDGVLYDVRDRNGNILSLKKYEFDDVFGGVRLTKQRIGKIKREITRVNRYDIINLCFMIYSARVGLGDSTLDKPTKRQVDFIKYTNSMLERCMQGTMNLANAYDLMVLCCVMSKEPLVTFNILWKLSIKR